MKTVLFVPGFRQSLETDDYIATIKAIQSKGYNVVFVPINWYRTTIDDWVNELSDTYAKYAPSETILAGFSYGAMTVLVEAAQRQPSELWLFSLSPYFSEDIPLLKLAWLRTIGKQRTERFWRQSFNSLARKITCKNLLFIGQNEAKKYPYLDKRVNIAHEMLAHNELIRIPNCDHDVTSREYIEGIRSAI
jgi:pimeloyl-ACP methyl ester carboxylesterase